VDSIQLNCLRVLLLSLLGVFVVVVDVTGGWLEWGAGSQEQAMSA